MTREQGSHPFTKVDHSSKWGSSPEPSSSWSMPLAASTARGDVGSLEHRLCGLQAT